MVLSKFKHSLARHLTRTRSYRFLNRHFGRFPSPSVRSIVHDYSRRKRTTYFLQVGGNDGITWDPFHFFIERDKWRGTIVEPQSTVFRDKLSRTYGDNPRVQLLNVAIDAEDGMRPLYKFGFSSARWAEGMASFDREHLVRNLSTPWVRENLKRDGIEVDIEDPNVITSEVVTCLSFRSVLKKCSMPELDFLITDVEGFDITILQTFPFDVIAPVHIIFELSTAIDEEATTFLNRLRTLGYSLFIAEQDVLAKRST